MICTTIEQSKKLLELGLNPDTSDMIYTMVNGRNTPFVRLKTIDEMNEDDIPAWSLSALLELMPNDINCLGLNLYTPYKGCWRCEYSDENDCLITKQTDCPFISTFEMVCWLLEDDNLPLKLPKIP